MSDQNHPRPVAVVVQTHWDREWYFPHQTFVARLLEVMETVAGQLESGALKHFLFDGQTAAFEDFCANAEPAMAARVQRLVREKRIALGPWYVMADEFLISGESLLRNLEIGTMDAAEAGNCQHVGYLPDTFGHVGQMPQILREFAIDAAVLWRGIDAPTAEWDWVAPDGSRVGGIFLTEGYYQHALNVTNWRDALGRYLEAIAPRSIGTEIVLTQGGDHLLPVAAVAERMAAFNAEQGRYHLRETTLADHVSRVLAETEGKRPAIHGGLRDNARAFVLPDVLSTRRYLKRQHQVREDALIGAIEPLWAMLTSVGAYPSRYIESTWRLLIQQQSHDGICGCSVDRVHEDMESRDRLIGERLDALQARALRAAGFRQSAVHASQSGVGVFADDASITLFNPSPLAQPGPHVISLFLAGGAHPGDSAVRVVDADGVRVPTVVLSATPAFELISPVDEFPEKILGVRYELLVFRPLAGLEARALKAALVSTLPARADGPDVADGAETAESTGAEVTAQTTIIENSAIRISLDEAGHITLLCRRTGAVTRTLFSVTHETDVGDSYNFSPLPRETRVLRRATSWRLTGVRSEPGFAEMTLALEMQVPACVGDDRRTVGADMVINRGALRLRLAGDAAAIDAELHWHNASCDQRTRLCLPLPHDTLLTRADAAFEWCTYPVRLAAYPDTMSRQEMSVVVNPSVSAISAGPWLVAHQGMQEYEVVDREGARSLAITLVRSVGWLSRRDLVTRGVGAGPDLPTPGAQCLGEDVFRFQLHLGADDTKAHPLTLAARFRRPALVLRGTSGQWRARFEIGNPQLQVSSLRRLGNALELRVWNPTATTQRLMLADTDATRRWQRVHADGRAHSGSVEMVAPHEIMTLRAPQ
jgi:hypothetical protein